MSPRVQKLIGRLNGVRKTGSNTWLAQCPAHNDRRPSLSIRDVGGKMLLHCFANCSCSDVVSAIGLELSDLFPERPTHRGKSHRPAFPAEDVLRAVANEAMIVSVAASTMSSGAELSLEDRARLRLAAARLNVAVEESGHA